MTAGSVAVAGRYLLGDTLGVGGMGRVWLARDEILQRDVAVKEIILPADLVAAERDAVHRRMLQEARAAARLSHPNVAQVYDIFEDDGRAWIVMEYVPSRSLQEVVKQDGPMEPRRVAALGLEILAALEAAHGRGVRHRDVKPANVLLGDDGRVVLTDFGIASIEGDSVVTTSSELVLGSPQYMSPERARYGTAEPASDLWSLGATLYTAVEGRSPFERPSAVETLTALAADEPDPPRRAGPLRPVLDGLLRKDPAERIDAAGTRRLLEAAMAEPAASPPSPTAAASPVSPAAAPALESPASPAASPAAAVSSTGRRRRPVAIAAVVTVLVLLAGAVATWFATRRGEHTETRKPPPATAPATSAPATSAPAAPAPSPSGGRPSTTTSPPTAKATTTGRQLPPRPAGWRDYRDKTGFALYVPEGWTRSREGSMVYFRDRSTGRTLGIDQTDQPKWDPVADWRGKADYRVARGDFPGYHEIHIREVRYFRKAADWEFTFDGGSRQHVNNRGVVTSADQAYGIYWQTRDADWAAARDDLQLVFDSFRPASD
ncbi:serine/threonine-protein kinase [Actinoplanes sp. NPDC049316]|uniref:serine/threonine-protein kinase n=1 Tax=Actinoplanes sp. NPDC049316 TaxID=3154727 RepID=UPI003427284E